MKNEDMKDIIINKELLQTALDAIPTMVAIKNVSGVYIMCNEAVNSYYKDKFDTIVGLHVNEVYPEDEAKIVLALDNEVIKSCAPTRKVVQVYTKNGYITVDLNRAPVLDSNNNIIAIISVGNDVTEKENLRKNIVKKNIALDELSKKYMELAHIDELTKIENRRKFYADLKTLNVEKPYTLILTDLNHFKLVNDELGHDFGDKVLYEFAQYTNNLFTEINGKTYRLSGDEFAILLPFNSEFEIEEKMNKIDEFLVKYHPRLSISYGHVKIKDGDDKDRVRVDFTIKRADELLYSYKKAYKSSL